MIDQGQLDAIYRERNQLVAALCKLFPSHLIPNTEDQAWPIACIHLPAGQVTWHIPLPEAAEFFAWLPFVSSEGHWDGHDTAEKYRRLNALPAHHHA